MSDQQDQQDTQVDDGPPKPRKRRMLVTESSSPVKRPKGVLESSSSPAPKSSTMRVRKASTPVRKVSTPVRKVSTPVRKVSTPVRKVSTPVRKVSTPVRKVSTVARKESTTASASSEKKDTEVKKIIPASSLARQPSPDPKNSKKTTLPQISRSTLKLPAPPAHKQESISEKLEDDSIMMLKKVVHSNRDDMLIGVNNLYNRVDLMERLFNERLDGIDRKLDRVLAELEKQE
ncbi:hypothetical protein ACHAQJ_002027 [Trichoderma viride]